jgi:hypothetical protein
MSLLLLGEVVHQKNRIALGQAVANCLFAQPAPQTVNQLQTG